MSAASDFDTTAPATKLYTPELLALAVGLAEYPLDGGFALRGSAKSRTCGSVIEFGCDIDGTGRIGAVGAAVTACAVGQAAGAIFLGNAAGRTSAEIEVSLQHILRWLSSDGALPDWPGFAPLASARGYPARHGAIALPWRAAVAALC